MIETWHRVVAGEWRQALDGLLADVDVSYLRSWRNQADGPSRRSFWNTRTRPSAQINQISEGH
jgi:hypothetical protein